MQTVILFGIQLRQRRRNCVQVRGRRACGHPGLHMADDPHEMGVTTLQRVPSADLRQVHNGRKQIRREEKHSAAEVSRRNPRNRVGMLVDLNRAAHRGAVAVEVAVPVGIAQDYKGHAVLPMLIGAVQQPAKIRLHAQRIEIIAADQIRPHHRGIPAASVESDAADKVTGNQGCKSMVSIAQIKVIGVGMGGSVSSFEGSLDRVKTVRVGHLDRTQHQRIQHAENDGIGANSQRQSNYGGYRESRGLPQLAKSKSKVGAHTSPLATGSTARTDTAARAIEDTHSQTSWFRPF